MENKVIDNAVNRYIETLNEMDFAGDPRGLTKTAFTAGFLVGAAWYKEWKIQLTNKLLHEEMEKQADVFLEEPYWESRITELETENKELRIKYRDFEYGK